MDIPGYEILKQIGQGGMATVYLALQKSLLRKVALKVLSPALVADPNFCERFLKEGKIIAQLSHPHIITIFDIGHHHSTYYMSMEYIGGGDLKQQIKMGMNEERAIQIILQIAHALGYAHDRGFLHRDVKPQNIMFRNNDTTVLTDFGIAKSLGDNGDLTRVGQAFGSPRYMSPEQVRGKKLDFRSDLYSLGILVFEMLTGSPPYSANDAGATARMHLLKPVPKLPADVEKYQSVINQLLAKSADERYANAWELIAELQQIANDLEEPVYEDTIEIEFNHRPSEIITNNTIDVQDIVTETVTETQTAEKTPIVATREFNQAVKKPARKDIKKSALDSVKKFPLLKPLIFLFGATGILYLTLQFFSSPDDHKPAIVSEIIPVPEKTSGYVKEIEADVSSGKPNHLPQINRMQENKIVRAEQKPAPTAATEKKPQPQTKPEEKFQTNPVQPQKKIREMVVPREPAPESEQIVPDDIVPEETQQEENTVELDSSTPKTIDPELSGPPPEQKTEDTGVIKLDGKYVISPEFERTLIKHNFLVSRLVNGSVKLSFPLQTLFPDGALLSNQAQKQLEEVAFVLRNYTGFSITIIDRSRLEGQYGDGLELERAKQVSSFLISRQLNPARIHARSDNTRYAGSPRQGIEIFLEPSALQFYSQ